MLEQLEVVHPLLPMLAGLALLAIVAIIADLIVKRIVLTIVRTIASRNRFDWDDALVGRNVFGRLSQVVPALIIYSGIELVPELPEAFAAVVKNVANGYLILMLTLTLSAALRAGNDIYDTYPISKVRPLTGFVQLFQIVVFIVGGLLIVSVLIEQSPILLLSGLGAMTAVLLLVFKDTILGLVASVQLTTQDMVRVGDWVEMPQYGADGDVIEVGLHTVRVQNFDRTITTIPTYKLISESFRNWRGMSESGGRRIKRAVLIDQQSIRFLSDDEIAGLERFELLRPYLARKCEELEAYRAGLGEAGQRDVNQRRLTNVGTYRAYVFAYLGQHPEINEGATLLVRQLPPRPEGLPLEIYCFTQTTQWQKYEDVQSDIFDHIIAITPEFDLHLYQQPSGTDLRSIAWTATEAGRP